MEELPATHGEASSSGGAPLPPEASLTDPQAPMPQFNDIYGDMRQKHIECRNCCVLIRTGRLSQCGFILACGNEFCCVLTTELIHSAKKDFIVTFGDHVEMNFSANSVVVHNGSKLAILFIYYGGMGRVAKQSVEFSAQDETQEAVVYTLSYIPKAYYELKGCRVQCDRANSYFRGGNIGVAGRRHEEADIFYHNCCVGNDIIKGSVVLNESCEVIGMNMEHSTGWTMSLCLNTIQVEIAKIFPDTKDMTLAGMKEYLKNKGEVETNKSNT